MIAFPINLHWQSAAQRTHFQTLEQHLKAMWSTISFQGFVHSLFEAMEVKTCMSRETVIVASDSRVRVIKESHDLIDVAQGFLTSLSTDCSLNLNVMVNLNWASASWSLRLHVPLDIDLYPTSVSPERSGNFHDPLLNKAKLPGLDPNIRVTILLCQHFSVSGAIHPDKLHTP